MKRTEKYKDSYQYDDQYQQRNQKVGSINNVNKDVKVKKITEEMNLVKSIIIKIRAIMMKRVIVTITIVTLDVNNYWKKNEKIKIKTLVNRYYCNSSFNYWHFATKSYIDHKMNRTINNILIMQQMMYLKIINKKFKIKAIISRNKLKMQK